MTNAELGALARKLRRNMTPEERILWKSLEQSQLGVAFRRQEPMRPYIVDFVCFERRLILEVDGSQHADNSQDTARDDYFRGRGFRTLRFWNSEVRNNLEGVVETIRLALEQPQN